MAEAAHCNDNDNDDGNLRIGHSEKILLRSLVATLCGDDTPPHQKASTSLSVLEYLAVSTRVLGLKYCSTCKEVLIVMCSVLKKVDRLNLESDIGLH